jgi:hypothetical protein
MTTPSEPTPPQAAPASYWQAPPAKPAEDEILPWFRTHVVALVAALLVQATLAFLGVLPALPVQVPKPASGYFSQPSMFWLQFATIEFIAAVVIALGFRPGVRLGDLPVIAQLALSLGFVVLPTAAIVLGGLDAAQAAARVSPNAVAASWLSTTTFGILFFSLPLVALVASTGRATKTA